MKKRISFLLVFAMVVVMLPTMVFAESGAPLALVASMSGTNVTVKLMTTDEFELGALDFTANVPEGLTLTSMTKGADLASAGLAEPAINGNKACILAAQYNTATVVPSGKELMVMVYDASTFTGDTMQFSINITAAADFDDATYTWQGSTLSSNSVENTKAYAATIAASATNADPVRVGHTFRINVGANKTFASTEMTVTYPSGLARFDAENSTLGTAEVITDAAGVLKIADYGADKTSADKYVLAFTAIASGEATFAVTNAGFGTAESAETLDLEEATVPSALVISINNAEFSVTFSPEDIFEGTSGVNKGETYTFKPETATGSYYDYTLTSVKMGGTDVTASVKGDATIGWSVENVTGNLVITGSRTPKQYDVTWSGTGYTDVTTRPDKATYGTALSFTMPTGQSAGLEAGYEYSLSITINNTAYRGYTTQGQVITIPGTDIVGAVKISVTKETLSPTQFTVTINGSADVAASTTTPYKGDNVTLTLTPETGYKYEITINGEKVTFVSNAYTVVSVQANVVVNVTKTLNVEDAEAKLYLALDNGVSMKLITIGKGQYIAGKTYTYDGKNMYWSNKYNSYAILVIEDTADLSVSKGFALVTVAAVPTVSYNGDVNGTGVRDANDAQLVYNMYNVKYNEFTANVTMDKFLKADVNGDGLLNVSDASAIISQILNGSAN